MDGCWLGEQDEGDGEEAFDPFDLRRLAVVVERGTTPTYELITSMRLVPGQHKLKTGKVQLQAYFERIYLPLVLFS